MFHDLFNMSIGSSDGLVVEIRADFTIIISTSICINMI